jgi:hypothetical protein
LLPEQIIVEVPALKVKPVFKVKFITAVPLKVIVLLPRLIVRVLLAVDNMAEAVTLKLFVVNVPSLTVILVEQVKASPSVTVMPVVLITTDPKVLPALVRVPVPAKVNEPLYVNVIAATRVTLPDTVIAVEPAKVPVNPVQLIDLAPVFPAEIVQVTTPDAALKNTSSADVGTAWPPAPPEVNAHLVPAVPSHEAVPPTQKRFAIDYSL